MAGVLGRRVRSLAARVARVIRVEALWLAVAPLDMRAGMDTFLAQVVRVFGEARLYCPTKSCTGHAAKANASVGV